MTFAYGVAALAIYVLAQAPSVRWAALIILIALAATKLVTMTMAGVWAVYLWAAIWAVAAAMIPGNAIASALLFLSGLCYLPVYLAGARVGLGEWGSVLIDTLGLLALVALGGRVVSGYLGHPPILRPLGMAWSDVLGRV